jgi:hypothetical protein
VFFRLIVFLKYTVKLCLLDFVDVLENMVTVTSLNQKNSVEIHFGREGDRTIEWKIQTPRLVSDVRGKWKMQKP